MTSIAVTDSRLPLASEFETLRLRLHHLCCASSAPDPPLLGYLGLWAPWRSLAESKEACRQDAETVPDLQKRLLVVRIEQKKLEQEERDLEEQIRIAQQSEPESLCETAEVEKPHQWLLGESVERLLDDVSDIWAGAVVVGAFEDNLYDISYADNGSVERGVEGTELRPRKVRLDMPAEMWESVGGCLYDCHDLCRFEQIASASCAAMRQRSDFWWCTAFHERFGHCTGRCQFERVAGREGSRIGAEAVMKCFLTSTLGQTTVDRTSWKLRYNEHSKLIDPGRRLAEELNRPHIPGDKAYAVSGKTCRAEDPWRGYYFDPRMGCMVREG